MKVLELKGISKKIGKRSVIQNIDMEIGQGEIFGFLGPNGAGKTTTIRMMTGLISPTAGDISVMGYSIRSQRNKALSYIGAIVENPEMYPYLTGWENLMQFARMDKRITEERVMEAVGIVKLTERIYDKVKTYSLGMKQRLGVAQAILHKPVLLILDEPTNGLDPNGIIEFRQMIRRLAREEGMAIFISSHILSEVEQLCDRAAIVNHGIVQAMVNVSEVGLEQSWTELAVRNPDEVEELIKTLEYVRSYQMEGNGILVDMDRANIPSMVSYIAAKGALIEKIMPKTIGLEEKYMKIVGG